MSSRKLSGLDGVRIRLLLGNVVAPAGESVKAPSAIMVLYTFAIALPSGVISAAILLFGIGVVVPGKCSVVRPWKFPASIAMLGTENEVGACCWRSRFHSSPPKKNRRSLKIGPPKL